MSSQQKTSHENTQHTATTHTDYTRFINSKIHHDEYTGFEPDSTLLSPKLFDFQKDIINWSCRRGRSALFAGTGLGKTICQLSWANQVWHRDYLMAKILILAPLAVAPQTRDEGIKFNIDSRVVNDQSEVRAGINITNYEKIHKFDLSQFQGIVLDESSIIKNFTGKTRNQLIDAFTRTPYKLACTATPAPNDYMELGNHSEFLSVMSRTQMLSQFFIHDGGDTAKWRLKGHAQKIFWEWLANFACVLRKPSDLGYDDDLFDLPKLHIHSDVIESTEATPGYLFPMVAKTLHERRHARRTSLNDRVARMVEIRQDSKHRDEIFLIWCDLNDEADQLEKLIPQSIQIAGRHDNDYKEEMMLAFARGDIKTLITKPSICGWGMNWQICHNAGFVGLSDSFEQYYQAVRRIWRFGQTEECNIYIITSDTEGAVVENIKRKERESELMINEMVKLTKEITKMNIMKTKRETDLYMPGRELILPEWVRTKERE